MGTKLEPPINSVRSGELIFFNGERSERYLNGQIPHLDSVFSLLYIVDQRSMSRTSNGAHAYDNWYAHEHQLPRMRTPIAVHVKISFKEARNKLKRKQGP